MATITGLAYGSADCRVLIQSPDLDDADTRPDEIAPSGMIYLKARKPAISTTSDTIPTIAIPDIVPLAIDADGYGCIPDAFGNPTSQRTVDLPAVEGMTWTAEFDLTIPPYTWQSGVVENKVTIKSFEFPITAGTTTHIADYLPLGIDPSTGSTFIKGDRGISVSGARVDGMNLILTLEDGTDLAPMALPQAMKGNPGPPGPGVPDGGTAGQIIVKTSGGSTEWQDLPQPVLDPATPTTDGLMPAADKLKLDRASSLSTGSQLVIRDESGRAQFTDPAAAQDASTKHYADALASTTLASANAAAATTVAQAMDDVVIKDDLFASITFGSWWGNASGALNSISTLMVAPYDLYIDDVTLAFDGWTLASDSKNFVTVTFRKFVSGSGTVMVQKSTVTEGVAARVPWKFDSLAWTESARTIPAGGAVNMGFNCSGSATVTMPVCVMVRYHPV